MQIPTVLSAQELLDKAFKKSSKIRVEDKVKLFRLRKTTSAKINSVSTIIDTTLTRYISAFPNFDKVSRFYFELSDLLIGVGKLKKSLGGIDWCRKQVKAIGAKHISQLKRSRDIRFINEKLRSAYGRISSVVEQVSNDLLFLNQAKEKLQSIPCVESIPTVVIAGYPNVGKSLLVRKISTGKPKIAPYPFTTQGISVGHFEAKHKRYQVIDTPGLLDRELSKRGKTELQAILALKHLANAIIFILDPTLHCGYPLEPQLRLLQELKNTFNIPLLEVENKCDILKVKSNRLKISAKTGESTEELRRWILEKIEPLSP